MKTRNNRHREAARQRYRGVLSLISARLRPCVEHLTSCGNFSRLCVLATAVALVLAAAPAPGGLAEAKKLLSEKKFDQVDRALGRELQAKNPSKDVLQVSLDAAVGSGRFITAQRRMTVLLKVTGGRDLDMVYTGARIAESACQDSIALSRYVDYAQRQNARSDKLRHALTHLAIHGKFPQLYRKTLRLYGNEGPAWSLGIDLLAKLVRDGEVNATFELAQMLMEKFPSPLRVTEVHRRLLFAAENNRLGRDDQNVYVLPMRIIARTVPSDYGPFIRLLDRAATKISKEDLLTIVLSHQQASKKPLPEPLLRHLHQISELGSEDKKLSFGRKILAIEAACRTAKDARAWVDFLELLRQRTGEFRIKGRELITEDIAARLMDSAAPVAKGSRDLQHALARLADSYLTTRSRRAAALRKHAAVIPADYIDRILPDLPAAGAGRDKLVAETKRAIAAFLADEGLAETASAQARLMPWYAKTGDKAALVAAARDTMAFYPGSFNADTIRHNVLNSTLLTVEDKVALVREQLVRAGTGEQKSPMNQLVIRHMKSLAKKTPQYQPIVDLYKANKPGTDVASRYACMAALRRNARGNRDKVAVATVVAFLKEYRKPVPLGPETCKGRDDVLALRIMTTCYHLARGGVPRREIAQQWLQRASGPGAMLVELASQVPADVQAKVIARIGGSIESGDATWARLANLDTRPVGGIAPLTNFYARMGADLALRHVARQDGYPSQGRGKWSNMPEVLVREIDKIVALRGFKVSDPHVAGFVIESLARHGAKAPVSDKTADALWRAYTGAAGAAADVRVRTSMLRIVMQSGRQGAVSTHVTALLGGIGKLPLIEQARQLESICESFHIHSENKRAKAGPYAQAAEKLADVYSRMTDADWAIHRVKGTIVREMGDYVGKDKNRRGAFSKDGRLDKAAERAVAVMMARLATGTRTTEERSLTSLVALSRTSLTEAMSKELWQRAARMAGLYFRAMRHSRDDWESAYRDDILDLARSLEKAKAWEMLHVVLERLGQVEPSQALTKAVAKYRTAAANNITGLVAVPRGDKTYPLHQAAQLLALGSETRAWHQTRGRLNLLKESWSSFEPKYVAWCIDQMRKNKMTKDALTLAHTVLLRENDLDPETAARILLARGDIYRDQRRNDVAKIEYNMLWKAPRYRGTKAATQAVYHLVNLMIDTGEHTTAQQRIERLIDSVDLPVKAEGYFLMARLAYEQKNYEAAAENIDKVRMCVSDHVEAAFLAGLLKLKLPGGMINPEVEIGTSATRRILIPGEELSLKLQDPNLSIARDEKSIPIIVTTTSGKDTERVDLRSLVGSGNLFTGILRTALGQAKANNGVLEVTGADRVSYVIAKSFQDKNAINYPPKYLDIRTVGQLAASAGEILTPEEIEKRRLQAGLAAAASPSTRAAWERTAGNMVRPGNEIYLQVYDIDQDVTNGKDTVTVKLTTTNGDVIEAMKLTETSEHSAVFRAVVKTAVPLPKAVASDTFEGKTPSMAINSTRAGAWSSLADGAKPKWLGVDMMSSHEMKTVTAAVPDVARVKSVRLMARLAQDYREIASYPVAGVQRGLRAERFADNGMGKLVSEATVTSLSASPPKGTAAVRYSGMFVARTGGKHTFTIKTTGQVALSIGGKEIIAAKGPAAGEKTYTGQADITIDAAAIAGRAETPFVLVYIPAGKNDTLSLTWSAGGKSGPVNPVAMFPGGEAQRRDEIAVQYAPVADGGAVPSSAAAIASHFVELGRKGTIYAPAPSYSAPPAKQGVLQMTGSFYVPKARYMTLKLAGKSFEQADSWGRLFVDGKEVLLRARWKRSGGAGAVQQAEPTARVKLTKGVHRLRVAVRGYGVCAAEVLYENDARQFVSMPAAWFSADHQPQIAPGVSPEGHIGVRGGKFVCELTTPARLRAVRWVFDGYEGNAVAVSEIGVVDAEGKTLIPVKRDFTSATTNDVLEIAPGDRVTALYIDEKRPEGGSPNRRASLATGYYNGSIIIANEVITDTGGGMATQYFPARRCGVGDALAILVDEADNDTSPKRDTMDVLVETSGGQKVTLKALEMPSEIAKDAEGKDVEAHHAGKFLALLRLGKKAGKGTLAVTPGDRITVKYMDRENSDPGVAVYRNYELFEGGDPLVEQIDFERYTSQLVRTEVKNTSGLMQRRNKSDVPQYMYVRLLSRTNAPRDGAKQGDPPVTSIRGPLGFSIMYPAMAKHTASTIEATVWAESDVQAAKTAKPKREPRILKVRMGCGSGGLDEGVFSVSIKLQVGLPGANVDLKIDEALAMLDTRTGDARKRDEDTDEANVLVVVPGDVVHVKYTDAATKKEITDRIQVLSEGGVEVLDARLQVELEQIRLGEKFHLRVDDTDRDTTPGRDTVTVRIASKCGDAIDLTLNETLARSGVFTGWVEPKLIGDKVDGKLPAANKTDDVLSAFFGDEIAFEYVDPAGVNSASPVTHKRLGRISEGSDARTDLFSKQFRDSEMAVKTSFLMAEALFELAKQKRELKQPDEAAKLIQRGKELLEITIRDYPGTKLKVQSRFLLANLAQELGKENEAIAKYSQVIAMAPQSDQASKSQFKMAQCYEQLGKFDQACEEYVKVTYVYESSPLAPKARMRMGGYYMKRGEKFEKDETKLPEAMMNFRVASRIFAQFRKNDPTHALAARAAFLSGECAMHMKDYKAAAATLAKVIEDYPTNKPIRVEAMYWCAESLYNVHDYRGAYRMWTELIWAYPEVRRAKEARGRLASDKRMIKIAEQDRVEPEEK